MSRSLQSLGWLGLVCVFTLMALASTGAHAQEFNAGPGPQNKISAGLLIGYGVGFDEPNIWGFGLGARAGYNLNQVYMGLRFMYNFGESYSDVIGLAEITANMWSLGIEGGYDFLVADKVTIRPELGLGLAMTTISADTDFGGGSESNSNFYMAFGAAALYDISPMLFIGLDTGIQLIVGDGSTAAWLFLANIGTRF